jgi:hypothetical protein
MDAIVSRQNQDLVERASSRSKPTVKWQPRSWQQLIQLTLEILEQTKSAKVEQVTNQQRPKVPQGLPTLVFLFAASCVRHQS